MQSAFSYTTGITALANLIAADKTGDQLSLISAVLTQMADTLATIQAQRDFLENTKSDENNDESDENNDDDKGA